MQNGLVGWILNVTDEWRDHRDDNYMDRWKEYERLWRGSWASEDRTRDSERSRIISPALQQAIENHTSEIEEAIFGQGEYFFDIDDDMKDQDPTDVEYLKGYMKECFKKNKLRKAVGDCLLLGAIFGTGIGEIILKRTKELSPATEPIPEADAVAIGVMEQEKINVILKPINPQNFLIDPNATCIEEAMGVAIEEFVSIHTIAKNIEDGTYNDVKIGGDSNPDDDLEASWIDDSYDKDKVKVIRYYGLVPEKLLDSADEEEFIEVFGNSADNPVEDYKNMVEAIVVIGNDNMLLKAERSPYMMADRPIVAFQDDSVPGRFWGRGIAEKGYNMQKAIDAQIRTHLDGLALTSVPMMAMDATRMPRGSRFEVRPGKTILTNGNPAEILQAFKFGQTDISNIETANKFEQMLLQATGTFDNAAVATPPEGGAMAVSLAGLIKRNKRTLVNFQDQFLIPFVEKAAWRFMQFDPENFPVQDWKFVPMSTMGMMAREVEQLQFINLMKTLGPDSPLMPVLMQGVIANSSMSNKNQLLQQMAQMSQPDPQQQQMLQMEQQYLIQKAQTELGQLQADLELTQAKTINEVIDAQLKPEEAKARILAAITKYMPSEEDKASVEFERRVKLAELMLKEQDMDNNLAIVQKQMTKSLKDT